MERTVLTCYLKGWRNTFHYKGYATRKEFWSFILCNLLFFLLVSLIGLLYMLKFGELTLILWILNVLSPLGLLFHTLLLLPFISLGVRRVRDAGYSGWWFGALMLANLFFLPLVQLMMNFLMVRLMDYDNILWLMGSNYILSNVLFITFSAWFCSRPTSVKNPLF